MQRYIPSIISLLAGILALFLVTPLLAPPVMSPSMRSDCVPSVESRWLHLDTSAWCPSYDQSSNAFFLWRPSVVTATVSAPLEVSTSADSVNAEFLSHSVVLFLGLALLFFQIFGVATWTTRVLSTNLALLGTLVLMLVFGSALLRGATLGSTALLAAAMHHDLNRVSQSFPTRGFPVFTVIVALLSAFHAHHLSPLCVLAAWWILRFLPVWATGSPHESEAGLISRQEALGSFHPGNRVLMIGLVPSLFSLFLVPSPPLPWYPQGSQVVPDDEIPGMLRPFFGPVPAVPFIDRWGLREWSIAPYQILLAFVVLLTIFLLLRGRHPGRLLVYAALPLGLLLLAIRMPEPISVISPLLVLPRILPPLFLIPLEPIVLALATLGTLIVAASFQSVALKVSAPLLLALLAYIIPVPVPEAPVDLSRRDDISPDMWNRHHELMRSPSSFVLRAHHWDASSTMRNWILERENLIKSAEFRRIDKAEVSVSVSSHPERAERMFDGRAKSRWTSGGGAQRGEEWVALRFNSPLRLDGIELYLGPYVTDFPRGLRLRALAECGEQMPPHAELPVVVEYPRWYGGLDFTPQGYPFFKGRYFTRVVFPDTKVVQCLVAEQIAENEGSDWSIAELRVAEVIGPP